MKISVTLPFPCRELNPNFKRSHGWWTYQRKSKLAFQEGFTEARLQGVKKITGSKPKMIDAILHITPPDNRRRDDDNMEGACKHHRDGIAQALGVDDVTWRVMRVVHKPEAPGKIVFELEFSNG